MSKTKKILLWGGLGVLGVIVLMKVTGKKAYALPPPPRDNVAEPGTGGSLTGGTTTGSIASTAGPLGIVARAIEAGRAAAREQRA